MIYKALQKALFQLDPETIHEKVIDLNRLVRKQPLALDILRGVTSRNQKSTQVNLNGINFPNIIGLAAGFDKNASAVDLLQALGFGFLEVGTITPKAQPGNPKPRLFRLRADQAIINRMGFNNDGINQLVANLQNARRWVPIGINIGKNKNTPLDDAWEDYVKCLEGGWHWGDYFTVNISSPNTKNLRDLQSESFLTPLIKKILQKRDELQTSTGKHRPVWLKIAPDLSNEELEVISGIAMDLKLDALIVSNTTIGRENLRSFHRHEEGGLSGKPLKQKSDEALAKVASFTKGDIPIIGVGGIFTGADAFRKICLGASLVQVYTGLIYQGPMMVRQMLKELDLFVKVRGFENIQEAVGSGLSNFSQYHKK